LRRFFATPLGGGLQAVIVCVALALVAYGSDGLAGLDRATVWLDLGIFALSIGFMWGYGGILSVGQAAFFGLGAYGYAWLTTDTIGMNLGAWGSLLGPLFGVLLAAMLALSLGYFLIYGHVTGVFFAIVTMALSFMMQSLGAFWSDVFGGSMGISNVPPISIEIASVTFSSASEWSGYLLVSVVLIVTMVIARLFIASSFGMMMDGVRDNEERFLFLGARTAQIKLIVFVVGSSIAGLAGALYAADAGFISSDLMGNMLSFEAVMWVAVGGIASLIGAVVGTLVVRGAGFWLSGVSLDYWLIVLGGLYIAIVLFGSSGLAGLGNWIVQKVSRATDSRTRPTDLEGTPPSTPIREEQGASEADWEKVGHGTARDS
jgi:ABC-type branched-subunit amino acid transport system permease subunit